VIGAASSFSGALQTTTVDLFEQRLNGLPDDDVRMRTNVASPAGPNDAETERLA
jgi:hypothetical protein